VAGLVNISPLKGRTGLATGLCKGALTQDLARDRVFSIRVSSIAITTPSASYLVRVSIIEVLWPDLSVFLVRGRTGLATGLR
jgi:hypothetical protein